MGIIAHAMMPIVGKYMITNLRLKYEENKYFFN